MASWTDAGLPMGLVFFGLTVATFLRKKTGRSLALRAYPELAAELGLTHKPSPYQSGLGSLSGTYEGFRVLVDPDDQRAIILRFETGPALELYTYEDNKRPRPGYESARLSEPKLKSVMKTVRGSSEALAQLEGGKLLLPLLPVLRLAEAKSFTLTERGMTVVFDYGMPPYIPAGIARDVLGIFVRVARLLAPPTPAAELDNGATEAPEPELREGTAEAPEPEKNLNHNKT